MFHSVEEVYEADLEMIDCTYELRIYAPVGGIHGEVTIAEPEDTRSRIIEGQPGICLLLCSKTIQ